MKKVILSLPLLVSLLVSADNVHTEDCIETFQRELSEILYTQQNNNALSVEQLTQKVNSSLDKDCDLNISTIEIDNNASQKIGANDDEHVLVFDSTKKNEDCIENFQRDVRKILNENTEEGKTKKVKVVIKEDSGNCTKEPTSK